jgi:hypothetical protein
MEIRCYGFDYHSEPAAVIWFGRSIPTCQTRNGEIPTLPPTGVAGGRPLIEALHDEARSKAESLGHIALTVGELCERGSDVPAAPAVSSGAGTPFGGRTRLYDT